MHFQRRQLLLSVAMAVGASLCNLPAMAQALPPGASKIVVPLPAGGAVDIFVRKLGEALAKNLNNPVIIENKPGASGQIAVQTVAPSTPDGTTMLYIHTGVLMVQAITGRFDVTKDFKAVAKISSTPHVLVVPGNSAIKSLPELIKAIQTTPGKLNYGSGGQGSPTHLMFEKLDDKVAGGLNATHIPFKGAVDAVVAVLGGSLDFTFAPLGTVQEHLKTGKLRAIATTGTVRMPQLAQVPTVIEGGVAGYVDEAWGGIMVPAATPDAAVAKLHAAFKNAIADPELIETIHRMGGKFDFSTSPASFAAQIKDEIALDKTLVVKLGLKGD